MVHPYFSKMAICVSVSGEQRLRSPISQKSTGKPSCIRSLPTANPSPPLFPQPAAISVLFPCVFLSSENAPRISPAQARAARSISTREGTPKPSIVFLSHSFISDAVTRYSIRLTSIFLLLPPCLDFPTEKSHSIGSRCSFPLSGHKNAPGKLPDAFSFLSCLSSALPLFFPDHTG